MRIGIIGMGGVGKALIDLLIEKELEWLKDVNVIFVLKSDGGYYNNHGLNLNNIIKNTENKILDSNYDYIELLNQSNIDYLIELTPTNLENGQPGLFYIREALKNGIGVVTGNKGPIALYYKELKDLSIKNNVKLLFGCTTGGALPALYMGSYGLAGDDILSISGVLNGSTNYILDLMYEEEISFDSALNKAIELGIAETNPSFDVKGYDTAIKLLILTNVLFNTDKELKDINIRGIDNIDLQDVLSMKKKGLRYRLIGESFLAGKEVILQVEPRLVDERNYHYNVKGKDKSILYHSKNLGNIFVQGGASSTRAAAQAILRDLYIGGYTFGKR